MKEEKTIEQALKDAAEQAGAKPVHGTRKRTIEKAKKKGTKNHGENEPEI